MANMCSFLMKVRGKQENIEQFYKALVQDGKVWMGRGADADLQFEDDGSAFLSGWCKWSVRSALIDNAISMRTEPDKWYHEEGEEEKEYITLFEACDRWSLDMEVYSEECGCCFQEHYVYIGGELVCEGCVEWYEYGIYEYETKEEAEKELGIEISDDEWNSGEDYISRGGFKNWNFEI